MARLLIVDDEPDIYQLIRRYAEREGHETAWASDGLKAVELCRERAFDLIIMDAMMPEMDGFTACKEIRRKKDIPVLMLSARGTEYDKLFGFEMGIDDYVVKPFSLRELMARVNVIVNRHRVQPGAKREQIEVGTLRIDVSGRNVYVDGEKTELTAKEYDLLVYLVKNRGMVLTREQILNAVWGYEYQGADRTVDWQIKLLRNKLGSCRSYLATIRGVGYKFEAEA